MRRDRATQRSLKRNLAGLAQIVYHVFAPWHRQERLRWGAAPEDPDPSWPGEDLIAEPEWGYTHAVSIDAPAERVWPWVAQLGQGRGGFYSFELLEDLIGCRITNADTILPEHQHPSVGDEIRLHPTAPPLFVAVLEPGRSMVLRGAPAEEAPGTVDSIWAFHVLPTGEQTCRLVERGKTAAGYSMTERLFFSPLLIEPIGFVMSREMLLGIKDRAERMAP
jgi:hypothetical protein